MMDAPLLGQRCNRLRARDFPARGVNGLEADVLVDRPNGRLDKRAALVGLGNDPVGAPLVIEGDGAGLRLALLPRV